MAWRHVCRRRAAWTVNKVDGSQSRGKASPLRTTNVPRHHRTRLHSVWSGLQLVVFADTLRKSGSACLAITSAVSRKLEQRPTWRSGTCRGVSRCCGGDRPCSGLHGTHEQGIAS